MENLLGEHSALVNLDSLVDNKKSGPGGGLAGAGPAGGPPAKNPFAEQPNPFQAAAAPKPSMNQLRGGNQVRLGSSSSSSNRPNIAASGPDGRRLAEPDSKHQHRHQSFLLVSRSPVLDLTQPTTE